MHEALKGRQSLCEFEVAEDGELDLGPALRSLLRNAYWAIDGALARCDVASF